MSIIQQLRDKAAVLLTALIAISLIGFLVQDAFVGRSGNMFSGRPTSVGTINGKKIDITDFNNKVNQMEQSYRAQGMQSNEMMTQNTIETVWNGEIQQEILDYVTGQLGLTVTNKEIGAVLFSDDAPQQFKQMFQDKTTGAFDANAAKNWFNNVKKNSKPEDAQMIMDQLIKPVKQGLLAEKYTSLIGQGSYVPKWMIEKLNTDNSGISSISFVGVPYASIADSTIKISDEEINEYVAKHEDDFKQEHVKGIAFVSFSANPTAADSQKVYNQLSSLKADFLSTTDAKGFVTKNNTTLPFYDGYALKSKLQMSAKDSVASMSVGSVIGPYLDGGAYVLAKKIDSKTMPDSVKCRHILIGVVDPQTGQQRRSDSAAKKLADSVFMAVKSGSNFGALAASLSDDAGSKSKGGEYDFSSLNMDLAKEFSDFIFNKPKGSLDVVKTQFGYHIIEVLNQKNFEPAYKVAYLSKNILASEATDMEASSAATKFSSVVKDQKSFDDEVARLKISKGVAENIKEMDYSASGLASRAIVKWAFENSVGTVSEPFDLKDQYVVAIVTGEIKEGLQPASVARVLVEPTLRNKKKAEIISKKAGSEKDLQKLAGLLGGKYGTADSVKFGDPFVPNLGSENKVIGAAFNKNNLSNVSELIDGQNGMYFVKVGQIGSLPSAAVDIAGQKKAMEGQMKQFASYSTFEALKKSIKIVDKRREAGY